MPKGPASTRRAKGSARAGGPSRSKEGARHSSDASPSQRPLDAEGILDLQSKAGNESVTHLLQAAQGGLVVQRVLIPSGEPNAGRLPAVEKTGLKALLRNNGFSLLDVKKALQEEIDKELLEEIYDDLKTTDGEIDGFAGKDNFAVRARKKRRDKIADLYSQLLQVAEAARDEATETYERNVDVAAEAVKEYRTAEGHVGQIFKKNEALYHDVIRVRYGRHIGFVSEEAFFGDVFTAIKASTRRAPALGLSAPHQALLDGEKQAVNAQLVIWRTTASNAVGTNTNGTWGTSFGGAGPGFQIRRLPRPVWVKLQRWWIRKTNAYVTDSDTSTYALKMWRDPQQFPGLSPTINYHVNVG